jgi:hypothetical protein
MKVAVLSLMTHYRPAVSAVGPYALAAILIPGGTLIALAVFLYRRYRSMKTHASSGAGAAAGGARTTVPKANYNSAVATAIKWLGDRYLLAQPVYPRPPRRSAVTPSPRARISAR